MKKPYFNLSFVLILIAGIVPAVEARQDQSGQPIPAYHSPLASVAGSADDQDTDAQTLAPDTRALTGAQNFSIGVPLATQSYWQPSFNLSSTVDSNALEAAGNSGWTTWTSISAGINVHRESGTSNMNLNYLAGGMLSNSGNASNGLIQALNFQDKLTFRRSTLSFFDALNYLPESQFGFGGLGGVQIPGAGALGGNFTPGQTALTPRGQNLTNSFVTEFDESLTARTSLTFVGGYSLLHSTGSDLFNYGDATFQAGYNHQMSQKNTVGLSYLFSAFRYNGSNQSINTNTVTGSYGRRVTGRLGFQVSGGPQFVFSRLAITGAPETPDTNSTMKVYWSAQTSLQYQLGGTGLGVTYNHGVTGGSGVLPGSVADTIAGNVNQRITRATSGMFNFGYSRNAGISQGTGMPTNQAFNYAYGGATISHPLGRELNVTLTYQAQYQISNGASCAGAACGENVLRHMITIGVGWQRQPIPIE